MKSTYTQLQVCCANCDCLIVYDKFTELFHLGGARAVLESESARATSVDRTVGEKELVVQVRRSENNGPSCGVSQAQDCR